MVKYLLAGDPGSIPGLEGSPGEGNDSPLQYSCLENSMDRPWGHKESDMTEGQTLWASLVAQTVKNPPAMQETWVQSLGWEEGMATHSSILVWKIPMDKGSWCATVHGVAKSLTRLSE